MDNWSQGLEKTKASFERLLTTYAFHERMKLKEEKNNRVYSGEAWASCCIEGKVYREKLTGLYKCTRCNGLIKLDEV